MYVSSNGTELGKTTVTYKFGTTNVVYAPEIAGYNTPGPLTVNWNSTKTEKITFTYTPTAVSTSQSVASGSWWKKSNYTYINYNIVLEYQNRTANSIQVRAVWTNTFVSSNGRYGYGQYFNAICGDSNTGSVTICNSSTWTSSYTGTRTQTAYSGWLTVPVNTTNQTSLPVSGSWWDQNGKSGTWTARITIPAY